jgi:hypothetical protein
MEKICTGCNELIPLVEFISANTISGYGSKCKPCYYVHQKNLKKKNQTNKKYYRKNREKMLEYSKNYVNDNREKTREKKRRWRKKKRETDPTFKLWENARKRIWKILHNKKPTNTDKLIGTTPLEYKEWLEYTFTDEMTWQNYGTYWHIDHVIPLAKHNLEDKNEIFKAFNWKNCRAEPKTFNILKNDDLDYNQITKHYTELINFQKQKSLKLAICNQAFLERDRKAQRLDKVI